MISPNLKKVFLQDLDTFVHAWKYKGKLNEAGIMADLNDYIGSNDLADFYFENDLVDVFPC